MDPSPIRYMNRGHQSFFGTRITFVRIAHVLSAHGLICVGTNNGKIFVYDFKQTLEHRCVLDENDLVSMANPLRTVYNRDTEKFFVGYPCPH